MLKWLRLRMNWLCSIQEHRFIIYLDRINKREEMNYYSSNASEILKGVLLKIQAFWDVTLCQTAHSYQQYEGS